MYRYSETEVHVGKFEGRVGGVSSLLLIATLEYFFSSLDSRHLFTNSEAILLVSYYNYGSMLLILDWKLVSDLNSR